MEFLLCCSVLLYSSSCTEPIFVSSLSWCIWHFPPADKVLPSVLQKAEVSLMSQTECKKSYGPVSPRMLCAGVPSGERDACRVSLGLRNAALCIKKSHNYDHPRSVTVYVRAILEVLCPVRLQEGVAGSWSASSAGGRAVADQTFRGSTQGSTSSPPGSTAISADIVSFSSTASKCLNILSRAPKK